ncbi:hypothetical protein H8957_006171, partial [Semnopithecus entellus]
MWHRVLRAGLGRVGRHGLWHPLTVPSRPSLCSGSRTGSGQQAPGLQSVPSLWSVCDDECSWSFLRAGPWASERASGWRLSHKVEGQSQGLQVTSCQHHTLLPWAVLGAPFLALGQPSVPFCPSPGPHRPHPFTCPPWTATNTVQCDPAV